MGVSVAIGVGIGAVVGGGAAAIQSGGNWDSIWKGALVGAVGGAVGGWAAPALTGALGGTLGGMAAGGLGGVTTGVLGTALSGGNSSDYLKSGLMGGLTGAAIGGLGGYMSGGEGAAAGGEGVNPVTGEAVPTGSPEITPLPDGDLASGMNQIGSGAGAVEGTITGPTAAPTQATTTTPLADTVSNAANNQYAAANTGTMTDIGGSSAVPQELPGGVSLSGNTTGTTPTSSLESLGQTGQSQAMNSMKELGLDGVNLGEGQTVAPTANTSMAPATQAMNQSPTSYMDQFKDWLGGSNKGTGKMGLEDYLNMQGKAQLIGGGMKTLGALATAPETQANRNALMDLYNQQNAQNQYYANLKQQSYQNPQSYLATPEAQATRSAALQKLVAQNAMAGRRTAGGAMYNQLMQNQLSNLGAYRAGMPNANYGTAAQTLNLAQAYSPTADIMGGLASGITPLSLYSLYR